MKSLSPRQRAAALELVRRKKQREQVELDLFDKQLAYYRDPSQCKANHSGRRSGKSEGIPRFATLDCLKAGFVETVLIGGETKQKAQANHWARVASIVARHNLPLTSNAADGTWKTQWGSEIRFWGLRDKGAAELLRGFKLAAVHLDEVSTYSSQLPHLVTTILEPALSDTGGTLNLYGTPSVTKRSKWADICLGKSGAHWSVHRWDVRQNKAYPRDADSVLQQVLERNGWTWDNPTFQREWLGEFKDDTSQLVYQYDPELNFAEAQPRAEAGNVTIGIDFGTTSDACAWVVLWSPKGGREIYAVHAEQHWWLLPDDAAAVTKRLVDLWRPTRVVGDGGGLGAPYVLAYNLRYGHLSTWVEPAYKVGLLGQIAILNGEVVSRRFKCLPGAAMLASEMCELPWKDSDHDKVDESYQNHLTDACRYASFAHLADLPQLPQAEKTAEELADEAMAERQRKARMRR